MASKWIRKGDRVLVIAGNDKGKAGEVLLRKEERIVVQGVNVRKKHLRRTQQTQAQGGRVVEMEVPIHISNVRICGKDDKPLKLCCRQNKQGQRELVYKSGKEEVVYRPLKKPRE